MGVLENGTVSGELPSNEAFAVHYPGYPSSTSRAVESLGGAQALLKARTSPSNKLELRFRPDDPYSHPAFGELRPCNNNFLLKISKTQSIERNSDAELAADIVARVPQAYHFEGMVDYQHVVAVHADVARRKKRNWAEVEEPHFDSDREKLSRSDGKFALYLCKILDLYFSYHHDAYNIKGVYLHDPATMLAAVDPSLMTYTEGVVRVQTSGITKGLTILYNKQKRFGEVTEWTDKPTVKVAVTADAPALVKLVMERLMDS